MKKNTAIILMYVLVGCGPATTQVTETSKDPSLARNGEKFTKLLVIVDAKKSDARIMFESEFAKQLNLRGVETVTTAGLLPPDEKPTRERVEAAIVDTGIDAVFLAGVREIERTLEYVPPTNMTAVSYGGVIGDYALLETSPGYYTEEVTVFVESRLFRVSDEKQVWSATSETYNPKTEPNPEGITAFTTTILDVLLAEGNDFF